MKISLSLALRRKALSIAALQVLAGAVVIAKSAAAQEVGTEVPTREARVSLRLQKMPLSQMLNLLGVQTGVPFRYAAIPDTQATLELENAPLDSALRDALTTLGFETRSASVPNTETVTSPKRETLWLWRDFLTDETPALAMRPAATWQMWNGTTPPHDAWMKPPSPRGGEFSGTVNSHTGAPTGVPGVSPVGVQVRWRDSTKTEEEISWAPPSIGFHNEVLPGAQIEWPVKSENDNREGATTAANRLAPRLRWPLWLRDVPARAQLVVETDRPATLWVNGARILRGWSGVRRLELAPTLQVGLNLLAIEWETPAPKPSSDAKAQPQPPLLRYEWLVGS